MPSRVDPAAPAISGGGRFQTTRWSMVLGAGDGDTGARDALTGLCARYRPPVLAYVRRHASPAEALRHTAR